MSAWDGSLALLAGIWMSVVMGMTFGFVIHWGFNKSL